MAELASLISRTSAALRARGIKGTLVAHDGGPYWRCTATSGDGVRKSRRIHLGLPAHHGQLVEAENRVIALKAAIDREGVVPEPLPWVCETRIYSDLPRGNVRKTVGEWADVLEREFWTAKVRNSAVEQTWTRLMNELRRLPMGANPL